MNDLSENDWVVIPAGKTVTAEHDGKPLDYWSVPNSA